MSVSSSPSRQDSVKMAIFHYVISYSYIDNYEFVAALEWASENNDILDSRDFLEFLAWWMSRNDFRNNFLKNSAFGIVQQFQGVLSEEASNYIDDRRAYWYEGIPLRMFLRQIVENFPPRSPDAPRFTQQDM
jgi:hypothetical protein